METLKCILRQPTMPFALSSSSLGIPSFSHCQLCGELHVSSPSSTRCGPSFQVLSHRSRGALSISHSCRCPPVASCQQSMQHWKPKQNPAPFRQNKLFDRTLTAVPDHCVTQYVAGTWPPFLLQLLSHGPDHCALPPTLASPSKHRLG